MDMLPLFLLVGVTVGVIVAVISIVRQIVSLREWGTCLRHVLQSVQL